MPREGRTTEAVTHGVSTVATKHPRLVLMVALTVLFIAMQGTVGAELLEPGLHGHSSDTGP